MLQKDSWPWTGGYGRGEERGAGKKRRKGEGAGSINALIACQLYHKVTSDGIKAYQFILQLWSRDVPFTGVRRTRTHEPWSKGASF